MKVLIEGIETYRLILEISYHRALEGCLYVPECARNLVYVQKYSLKYDSSQRNLIEDAKQTLSDVDEERHMNMTT